MSCTYKDIIDLAIGTPESGHVNFYALHVLLTNFARKLNCLEEEVEQDEYLISNLRPKTSLISLSTRYRLAGGADAEEAPPAEAPAKGEATPPPTEETEAEAAVEEPAPPPAEEAAAPAEETVVAEEAAPPPPPPPPAEEEAEAAVAAPEEAEPAAPEEPALEPEPEPEPEPAAAEEPVASQEPSQMNDSTQASTRASIRSEVSGRGVKSAHGSLERLERRLSKMEMLKEKAAEEMQEFTARVGNQMHLTMKQLNTVAHILYDRKSDRERLKELRKFAYQLGALSHALRDSSSDQTSTLSWASREEETAGEEEELEEESSVSEPSKAEPVEDTLGLEPVITYTPDRMLTELLELKSEMCALSNKVNDIGAAMLKQDTSRLMTMFVELQETVREIRLNDASSREAIQEISGKVARSNAEIVYLKKSVDYLDQVKIDKSEVELLLAEKVDFQQMATKVSLEQLEEYKSRLEKQFCEVRFIINTSEKNILQIIDNLRMSLGIDALELSLKDFREAVDKRVAAIAEALQRYMQMTNDECAAAAGRVRVMQDLSCLSCDVPCVMRTVERAKVGKLPTAKGSTGIGPLITYELGQVRKSGLAGALRKVDPKALAMPMNKCVGRHAGGTHTTHTAREHMEKVLMAKRNAGY